MESDKYSEDDSDISSEENNAPPVAFEKMSKNQHNENINNNNLKDRLIIEISPFYINKLTKEGYLDIIEFIKNNCDLTLKDNFSYRNNIFRIRKKKFKNTDFISYKLSLIKDEKTRIKEEFEKLFLEKHSEIRKFNAEEIQKNLNIGSNDNISNKNEIFYCELHKKKYVDKKAYINHFYLQHKYKCLNCGEIIGTMIKVQNHVNNCKKISGNSNQNENNKFKININNNIKNNSEFDDKVFKNKSKKEFSISIINDVDSKDNKINEIKENQIKKEEDIKVEKALIDDKSENKEYSYYVCYSDGKKFQNEINYIKHFEKYHPNDFPFYCELCQKGFYSSNAIENHIRSKGHK